MNFRTMSYDKFHTNCPHFAIGCCNFAKVGFCKYKYHKRCDENFLCTRYDCKYGHGITPEKRMIVNKIYDEKYSSSSVFETSENRCTMPMNCINKDCELDHHLEYVDRSFIYKIVNSEVTDKEAQAEYAQALYEKKYTGCVASVAVSVASSPYSDIMSAGSTVSAVSPVAFTSTPPVMATSFAGLFKNSVETSDDDEITKLMNEMMLIRKDITTNNKRVADIKEKILEMKDELVLAEAEEKSGKSRLKELALKISQVE